MSTSCFFFVECICYKIYSGSEQICTSLSRLSFLTTNPKVLCTLPGLYVCFFGSAADLRHHLLTVSIAPISSMIMVAPSPSHLFAKTIWGNLVSTRRRHSSPCKIVKLLSGKCSQSIWFRINHRNPTRPIGKRYAELANSFERVYTEAEPTFGQYNVQKFNCING